MILRCFFFLDDRNSIAVLVLIFFCVSVCECGCWLSHFGTVVVKLYVVKLKNAGGDEIDQHYRVGSDKFVSLKGNS